MTQQLTENDILAATPNVDDRTSRMRDGDIAAPFFGRSVPLRVIGPSEDHVVTSEMAAALTALLTAPNELMQQVEALLSMDCDQMCQETGFSIFGTEVQVGPDEDPLEAHRLAFGMSRDGRIPRDVISGWVSFVGLDIPNGAYVRLNPPWEQDHGVLLRLEDGGFITFPLRYDHDDEDEHVLPMPD